MTLSSSPHSSVWTPDPLDQFTAKVWPRDEKGSEQNRLICKFRNDCVSSTRRGTHASRNVGLKTVDRQRSERSGKEGRAQLKGLLCQREATLWLSLNKRDTVGKEVVWSAQSHLHNVFVWLKKYTTNHSGLSVTGLYAAWAWVSTWADLPEVSVSDKQRGTVQWNTFNHLTHYWEAVFSAFIMEGRREQRSQRRLSCLYWISSSSTIESGLFTEPMGLQ